MGLSHKEPFKNRKEADDFDKKLKAYIKKQWLDNKPTLSKQLVRIIRDKKNRLKTLKNKLEHGTYEKLKDKEEDLREVKTLELYLKESAQQQKLTG